MKWDGREGNRRIGKEGKGSCRIEQNRMGVELARCTGSRTILGNQKYRHDPVSSPALDLQQKLSSRELHQYLPRSSK